MTRRSIRLDKTPWLILACLLGWALIAWRYNPLLSPLLERGLSWPVQGLVMLAIGWINLIWFYAVYHLFSVIASTFAGRDPVFTLPAHRQQPRVSVLYTTCNDFDARAAQSCLDQDYGLFKLFLLDDSTDSTCRCKVDAFAAINSDQCTVIRRSDRLGFKAGNLNHALQHEAGECEFFAVIDADEVLPRDFLSRTVACATQDDRIGFVQANHRYRTDPDTRFGRDFSLRANLHWGLFLSARNRGGFVLFYGHGAIIRTETWRQVGGFPELVSEDVAFAAKVREHGLHGVFLKSLIAEESFPSSYETFLRRELKIFRGSLQFLTGPARSFFRSGNVGLAEKFDLLASLAVIVLPVLFVGYVLLANVVLPLLITRELAGPFAPGWSGISQTLHMLQPLGAGVRELWTWDFYLVTIWAILAPLIYQIPTLMRTPGGFLRYTFQSTTVFLSIIPALCVGFVSVLRGNKASFTPTGDRTAPSSRRWTVRDSWSAGGGAFLSAIALITGNLVLLTVALSFLMSAVLIRHRWESRWVRLASFVPFMFFFAVFGAIPFISLGVVGALAAVVPAHH